MARASSWPGRAGELQLLMSGANFAVRWEGYVQVSPAVDYTFIASNIMARPLLETLASAKHKRILNPNPQT